MTVRLREMARRALHERRPDVGVEADVERVVLDVRIGDRVEMVTIAVREERLLVLATDGAAATSPAAHAALRWLASDLSRTSMPPERRERDPVGPSVPQAPPLEAALADSTTAIVRAGTDAAASPAIEEAFARLAQASPSLEVARWVGRLRAALLAHDEASTARLLDAAHGIEAQGEPERLVDHLLVELGRELLDGWAPLGIERRHLLDPATGQVSSEDRFRDQTASHGPFPRVVSAGLAMRASTGRVRIVQYAVSALDAETLARVASLASPGIEEAFARAAPIAARGAIEPVSLVRVALPEGGIVLDTLGVPVPLARHEDPGAVTAALHALGAGAPEWLFGRWSFSGDEASLVPLSCSVDGRVVRLR